MGTLAVDVIPHDNEGKELTVLTSKWVKLINN